MCTKAGFLARGVRLRSLILLGILGLAALHPLPLRAENEATVSFSWKPVPGAGGYSVEVRDANEGPLPSHKVDEAKVDLSLPPGDYSIRIVSLNHFMRSEGASPWMKIKIVRKGRPAVEAISPQSVEPGADIRLVVTGKNLDAETAGVLRRKNGGATIASLGAQSLSPTSIAYEFPPINDVDLYTLELVNKPDYSLLVPDSLSVRHEAAAIVAIEPKALDLDIPSSLHLRFSATSGNIVAGASARLEKDGRSYELGLVARSGDSTVFELPLGMEEGDYDLVIENDILSISRAPAALRLFLSPPRPPHGRGPRYPPRPDTLPLAFLAEPEPMTMEVMAAPQPIMLPMAFLDLPEPEPMTMEVMAAPQAIMPPMAFLDLPEPDVIAEVASLPSPPPSTPQPTPAHAKMVAARKPFPKAKDIVNISMEWEYSQVISGLWQSLYPSTTAVANLNARLRLMTFRLTEKAQSPCAWGAELRARMMNYDFAGDADTYESSQLSTYSLEVGPWISLPILFARLGADIDVGAPIRRWYSPTTPVLSPSTLLSPVAWNSSSGPWTA